MLSPFIAYWPDASIRSDIPQVFAGGLGVSGTVLRGVVSLQSVGVNYTAVFRILSWCQVLGREVLFVGLGVDSR